ncbi:trypsin-like serine peptidase [Streptacidiphilus jiangxiensis]|uniref:Trypsin n=1 Tax=Streptacidiphilus jiangxiensis TaxID=235985 RepID=A0A1H7JJR6_STRJI|nr:hypothetical protein [Streptacidiphilus jiangxiensis]SEK74674.1 hypothetical protein SAMN05414137_103323 [Streptacidiphilus jiangxiensis]
MGERRRRRGRGIKAGLAGLLAVGVLGAVFAPSALAEISGTVAGAPTAPVSASPTPGAPGAGSMATAPRVVTTATTTWNAAAAATFWTSARLADAAPVDAPKTTAAAGTAGTTGTTGTASGLGAHAMVGARLSTPSSIARSTHFGGASSTGVIFYASKDMTTHYCTASVVDSHYGNLIIMAAHCNPGSWMAYVPKYQHGLSAARQPYGIWAVTKVFKDSHYTGGSGAGSDYDYAFAQVAKNSKGQSVQSVTGGNWLSHTTSYNMYVTALGYPKITADSADQAIRCHPGYATQKLPGYRQMVLYCTGFYGGTSGGPWLLGFNGNTGYLIGITGGYEDGGPNSWISYSPVFDSRIFTLFQYAEYH